VDGGKASGAVAYLYCLLSFVYCLAVFDSEG
jgi:hypothetical protein